MRGGGQSFVGAFPSVQFVQGLAGLGDGVHGNFSSDASGGKHTVGGYGVVLDRADEVFAPLLDCAGFTVGLFTVRLFTVNPVEMRLEIAVGTGCVIFAAEEHMAIVVGPAQSAFVGLVVGQLTRLDGRWLILAAGRRGRGRPRHIHGEDFGIFDFFLALVDGVGDEG